MNCPKCSSAEPAVRYMLLPGGWMSDMGIEGVPCDNAFHDRKPRRAKPRPILPKPEVIFRACILAALSGIALSLPFDIAWWAGLFLAYMAFNTVVSKLVANTSNIAYDHAVAWLRQTTPRRQPHA
jgi:hypothetical protein